MGYYKDVMNGEAIGPSRDKVEPVKTPTNIEPDNETGPQRIARQRQERDARIDAELAAMRARSRNPSP